MGTQKQEYILKIISRESDLLKEQILKCIVSNCDSIFQSTSNLKMHLEKTHKIFSTFGSFTAAQYYCPHNGCKYNISHNENKFFTSKKLLKQHYLKTHAAKNISCPKCNRKFSTEVLKMQHERACGKLFNCLECDASYTSRECLLTHCRRKQHKVPAKNPLITKKVTFPVAGNQLRRIISYKPKICTEKDIKEFLNQSEATKNARRSSSRKPPKVTKFTQTDSADADHLAKVSKTTRTTSTRCDIQKDHSKSMDKYKNLDLIDEESNTLISISSQTFKNLNSLNFGEEDSGLNCFANTNSSLCHIETQTEWISFDSGNSMENGREMDPMLCHTHTQTSDNFLTELGLTDIETQTNWSNDDYSDLFVTAETQTCFPSLIMDNNSTQTQTIGETDLFFKPHISYFESAKRCSQMQQTDG